MNHTSPADRSTVAADLNHDGRAKLGAILNKLSSQSRRSDLRRFHRPAGVNWSLSACEMLILALGWLHVVRKCKMQCQNGFRVGRRQMPAAMMRGSEAAMTTNGPLMAREDRITQPVRGVGGTITPLTRAIAGERVTRIEGYLEKWPMTACFLPAAGEALPAGASLDSSTRRPPRENQDRRQDCPDDLHDRR
jgi:hypothetical protein